MQANNKLRDALVKCREIALQWQADEAAGVAGTTDKPHARSAAEAVIDMEFELNAALAEPVKNCEVGTVAQQAKRFAEYCESEVCKRKRCKFRAKALCIEQCALAWAQMPYEEGGAK